MDKNLNEILAPPGYHLCSPENGHPAYGYVPPYGNGLVWSKTQSLEGAMKAAWENYELLPKEEKDKERARTLGIHNED